MLLRCSRFPRRFRLARQIAAGFLPALLSVCAGWADPVVPADYTLPVKVACVGDSITQGYGVGGGWSYPDQLYRMIGAEWKFTNFGVSGTTMLKGGDNPYWTKKQYADALQSGADVVVIALGTNDAKPRNWAKKEQFASDYQEMIGAFQALPNHPRLYLCIPPPVLPPGDFDISPENVEELAPLIRDLAEKNRCGLVDLHAALAGHPEWQPDTVHPDPDGDFAIAKAVYAALTGKSYEGGKRLLTQAPRPLPLAPAH